MSALNRGRRTLRTSGLLACVVAVVAAAVAGASTGEAGPVRAGTSWDVARDFRTAPNQANPSPDRLGNAAVWWYMSGRSVSTFEVLPDFSTRKFDIVGLQAWWGTAVFEDQNRLPTVGINATGEDVDVLNIHWPSGDVLVHPLPDEAVAVAWRSPIAGNVRITGSLALPQNPNCGNGVVWSVRDVDTVLRRGRIAGFGETDEWLIPRHHVARGDMLYLVVGAGNGNFLCDSTLVDFTIEKFRGHPSRAVL